ncbi:nucleoside phosphatase family-domain-containing protein [Amanita rubescens]|nr:nucleoside phosphatase family-domain-containing protein [Amanita rubescens]
MPRNRNGGGAYELVEGGYGGPHDNGIGKRGSPSTRFTWKRLAVGAVVFIGLVWVFGPRVKERYGYGSDEESDMSPGTTTKEVVTTVPAGTSNTHYYVDVDDDFAASSSASTSTSTSSHPTTYDSDPHPSQTTYCTTPHLNSSSLPLVQYALMIDAGSTGSRIHIYKFNNCRSTPTFEYEVFKMTKPGLSNYAGLPGDAARSLDVLLEEAMRVVPEEMRKCTPVAVKATAGLRLLPGTQSAEILEAVGKRIGDVYPFQLVESGGVVIMDGKDEGVYAWITANYLMGTIKEGASSGKDKDSVEDRRQEGEKSTYAVLDLGGASTQIVFEPVFEKEEERMEEGEHKYDLKFAGRNHVLYQHSYLDYGLMRARVHVHRLVDFISSVRTNGKEVGEVVGNPCLAKGTRKTVQIEDEKRNVTMSGEDVGSFDGCNRLMQLVLAKDAICELKPCSFDGVYQPSLLTSFPSGKVLLLSYFYDRLHPLLEPSTPEPLTVSTVARTARDVCEGRPRWLERWGTKPAVMSELEDRPEWCLDLTFMYTLLRLGYEFEDDREIKLGKKIRGTELGWCLGATIEMVGGSELTCRA